MIKHIKIGEKELPIAFTMRAINQFCIKHKLTAGQSFSMLSTGGEGLVAFTYDQIHDLFTFGLKEGARLDGSTFKLSVNDVWDLFDAEPGVFATIVKLYSESLAQKWKVEEEADEEAANQDAVDEKNELAPKAKTKAKGAQ